MKIVVLPLLADNYTYLLHTETEAAVVDPADADVVQRELERRSLTLTHMLITHAHHDHVGGVPSLKRHTAAAVVGAPDDRIPGLDHPVREGSVLAFGGASFTALMTPGHGAHDVSYLLQTPDRQDALFCGDTLFVSGCGRLLESDAETMWASLKKLAALPDDTELYCGHEYTEENLEFAVSECPDDPVYQKRLIAVRERLREGLPSVPSNIGLEKKANPFLRCESLVEFADLRKRKDRF